MAEGPADKQRRGSMDTEEGLLIQQEQPAAPRGSRSVSSPGTGEACVSLAATAAAPALGDKKPGYYSDSGYLTELSRQERRRITQGINKLQFKAGESL